MYDREVRRGGEWQKGGGDALAEEQKARLMITRNLENRNAENQTSSDQASISPLTSPFF